MGRAGYCQALDADDPNAGRPDPESDPDAALEAIAAGEEPPGPARRRTARAALEGLRSARRTARLGLVLAALALVAVVVVAVAALDEGLVLTNFHVIGLGGRAGRASRGPA